MFYILCCSTFFSPYLLTEFAGILLRFFTNYHCSSYCGVYIIPMDTAQSCDADFYYLSFERRQLLCTFCFLARITTCVRWRCCTLLEMTVCVVKEKGRGSRTHKHTKKIQKIGTMNVLCSAVDTKFYSIPSRIVAFYPFIWWLSI